MSVSLYCAVGSKNGNFLLTEENTAALGLCEVDYDTDSDDSAFGSDLDE